MALLKDLFPQTPVKVAKNLLDSKAQKIVDKALNVTIVDLYNLALINKERDEIDSKED